MSNANSQSEKTIIGLKTQVNRQAGLKEYAKDSLKIAKLCLTKTWIILHGVNPIGVEDLIWEYVNEEGLFKKEDSKFLGKKTVIDLYTKKDGKTILAHFTENGNYYGSIKTYGKEPVFYTGWFLITPDNFKVEITGMEDTIVDFFKPILRL